MAPHDATSRRRVLKLSGTALVGAVAGAGTASAIHESVEVATDPATDVSTSEATLHGELLDMGDDPSADVWFNYGELGSTDRSATPRQTLTSTGEFSATVDSLASDTTYDFHAVAVNETSPDTGAQLEFTTDAPACTTDCPPIDPK